MYRSHEAAAKRSKSNSPEEADDDDVGKASKRLFAGGSGGLAPGNEQLEEAKQLEAANAELRDRNRASAKEVDQLRAELQRAREANKAMNDEMDEVGLYKLNPV